MKDSPLHIFIIVGGYLSQSQVSKFYLATYEESHLCGEVYQKNFLQCLLYNTEENMKVSH